MNKIKQLREKNGMTQETLANKLGYSRTLITKWETGAVEPTSGQELDICDIFGVPAQFLGDKKRVTDKYNVEFQRIKKYKQKFLVSSITEDIIYLFACFALGIALFFNPSVILLSVFISLFGIGLIGLIVFIILLVKNTKTKTSNEAMKLWVIKNNESKEVYKKVKTNGLINESFDKIILSYIESKK